MNQKQSNIFRGEKTAEANAASRIPRSKNAVKKSCCEKLRRN